MLRRLATAWQRLRRTIRGGPHDLEFQAEIEEHVRLLADRYRRQGIGEKAALLAARRQFGNAALLQDDRRAIQTLPALEAFGSDLLFGVRMLRKNPAFALAAVVTLALGIGANTAVLSLCDAVLFTPLPYANPDRLVMLWERTGGGALTPVAPANFVDWRSASRSFSDMAALNPGFGGDGSLVLDRQSDAARLAGARVSSNFFSLDREGGTVDANHSADGGRIAAEPALPETVADDGNRRIAGFRVLLFISVTTLTNCAKE